MEMTTKLKSRFCKNEKLPINIFQEPYFEERLEALDNLYDCKVKYELFKQMLADFDSEEEFFEYYNSLKDKAISFIKNSNGYKSFCETSFNFLNTVIKAVEMSCPHASKTIYKPENIGKYFVSIDMKKANFSALYHYDKDIFGGAATSYEEFLEMFTPYQSLIKSKYIRQVILGNCNCKHTITYEKFLMGEVLTAITAEYNISDSIVAFTNDEIVFEVNKDFDIAAFRLFMDKIEMRTKIPLRIEYFRLYKIGNSFTSAYLKGHCEDNSIAIKCADSDFIHFMCKDIYALPKTENDLTFYYKGILCKMDKVDRFIITSEGDKKIWKEKYL